VVVLTVIYVNRFSTIQSVVSHLQQEHHIEVINQTLSFKNSTAFNEWKLQEEKKCKSYYVQNSSAKSYGSTKYTYLYCNRSGAGRFRGKGKRIVKSQGSCKIEKTCIAHMKVMEDTTTGQVVVEYCPTHNSHSTELAHLPIPIDIKHVSDSI
jgi:hypothetical protein